MADRRTGAARSAQFAIFGRAQMRETDKAPVGQIRTEVHGHVLKIVIDNAAKKNSFSPQMMAQMSDAMTLLDRTEDYWAGVVRRGRQ